MLSTPTAKTRKGITSTIIRVAGTPIKEKRPNDDITDTSTIKTPKKPKVNFDST